MGRLVTSAWRSAEGKRQVLAQKAHRKLSYFDVGSQHCWASLTMAAPSAGANVLLPPALCRVWWHGRRGGWRP